MRDSRVYLAAAGLSIAFYIIGVFSGVFIQQSSIDYTEEKSKSLQRQMENMQLEYAYLSIAGQNLSCDSLSILVSETTEKVRLLGKQLESNDTGSEDVRKEYVFLSTKAWILNNFMSEKCREDAVVMLYFYSVPCPQCIQQGYVIDAVQERYYKDELIVFVINADIDEPIVNTLKKVNKVSKTPAIVIGDETYPGPLSEEELRVIISEQLVK